MDLTYGNFGIFFINCNENLKNNLTFKTVVEAFVCFIFSESRISVNIDNWEFHTNRPKNPIITSDIYMFLNIVL